MKITFERKVTGGGQIAVGHGRMKTMAPRAFIIERRRPRRLLIAKGEAR